MYKLLYMDSAQFEMNLCNKEKELTKQIFYNPVHKMCFDPVNLVNINPF